MGNRTHLIYKILFIGIVFLSLSGIYLFDIGELHITPFYLFSPLLLLCFFIFVKKTKHYNEILSWAIFFAMVSTAAGRYLKPTALFHFLFYVINGVVFIKLLRQNSASGGEFLIRTNKFIIYLFSIDIIIANIKDMLNIDDNLLNLFFPTYYDYDKIRYAAFTSEPSYMAIILTVSMISIIYLRQRNKNIKIKKTFIFYCLALILGRTTYGFICIGLSLCYLFQQNQPSRNRKTFNTVKLVRYVILALLFFIGINLLQESEYLQRLGQILDSFTNLKNLETFVYDLNDKDSSAAMRILPTFLYFQSLNLFKFQVWFGHGLGANTSYFSEALNFTDQAVNLGYIPASFYDFGFIGASILLYSMLKDLRRLPWIFYVVIFLSLVNCNISTQLFWFIFVNFYGVVYARESLIIKG